MLNISLLDVDGKQANIALMKISAYEKASEHNVDLFYLNLS